MRKSIGRQRKSIVAAVLCVGLLLPGVAVAVPAPTAVEHHREADVVRALPGTPQELFTDEFLVRLEHPTGAFAEVLAANDDPCRWRPAVPVRLYAGTADRDVVFTNAESCENDLRARGARDVRLVNVGDIDHFGLARAALPEIARDW
jgi:hypothetical protein